MKVETPPVDKPPVATERSGVAPAAPVPPVRQDDPHATDRRSPGHDRRREAAPEPRDVVDLHGVEESQLTPAVQAALGELTAEIARLSGEVAQLRRRLAYVGELADQDPVSGVLNRRAFMRELSRLQTLSLRDRVESALVLFHIGVVAEADRAYGLAAGDTVVGHVGAVFREAVEEGDFVGRLCGAMFAAVFVGKPLELACDEAIAMAEHLRARPVELASASLTADAAIGAAILQPGADAIAALKEAELDLRLREGRHGTHAGPGHPPFTR